MRCIWDKFLVSTHEVGIVRHMLDSNDVALSAQIGSYYVKGPSTMVLSDLVPLAVHSEPAFATAQPALITVLVAGMCYWGFASRNPCMTRTEPVC